MRLISTRGKKGMKRKFLTALLTVTLALTMCACDDEYYEYEDDSSYGSYDEGSYGDETSEYPDSSYDESYDSSFGAFSKDYPFDTSLGSAKELEGNIAIISVFVNDAATCWDFENSADQEMESLIYNDLKIATEYLEGVAKDYGRDMDMMYDWGEHPELAYEITLNEDYCAWRNDDTNFEDLDFKIWELVDQEVPTAEVLQKTNCSQAVYMLYFNTPSSNTVTSCTRNYYEGMPYPYEMCYMFMNCEGYKEPPACFAHEILHTFGAVDLYMATEYDGMTQDYVDYAANARTNDIMRVCEDPKTGVYVYDSIKNDVTEITAYYVGLTDHSKEVDEWGLGRSQH